MIPKYRTPEIQEFMTGYTVSDYNSNSSSMNIFIPVLMLDRSPSDKKYTLSVSSNIFVSKEIIRVSSLLSEVNYISATVSETIRVLYRSDAKLYPTGTKVRVYIPNLDLHKAVIVPM